MADVTGERYDFGDVRVDAARFCVTRDGLTLDLEPKAVDVLLFLIRHRDRLVLKDELLDAVWRDTFVTPNALTRVIAQLRKALGDDAHEARIIETVPRKGYRFLPPVAAAATDGAPIAPPIESAPSTPAVIPSPLPVVSARSGRFSRRGLVRAALPLVAGAALASSAWMWFRPASASPPAVADLVQLTTGGYESDPAISPDGRRLAFTAEENGLTNIYVRPLEGEGRIRVTTDGQRNMSAAWSPDGEYLAYHSGGRGGVWIVPALGGTPRQIVAQGSDPVWSPDGRRLAYSTYEGSFAERGEIQVVDVGGGIPVAVTAPGMPRGGHRYPAFSRDGSRIAFSVFDGSLGKSLWIASASPGPIRPELVADDVMPNHLAFTPDDRSLCWSGFGPRAAVGIWCTEAAAPRTTPVAVLPGVAGAAGLSIARDGTIAYAAREVDSDLWAVAIAADGRIAEPERVTRDTSRNSLPAMSPDGRRVAYAAWRPGNRSEAWMVDLESGRTSLLSANAREDVLSPTWTPDSAAVIVATGHAANRRLVRIDVDTLQQTPLAGLPVDIGNIALSPDGRSIAYHVSNPSGGLSAWIVPIEGGAPQRLSPPDRSAGYPAWSPDGRRLAIEVHDSGRAQIWTVNRDGTAPQAVTSAAGQHWPHSWAPDGDRIAFAGERDGVWNVWTVSSSSGAVAPITRFTSQTGYVRYPVWSRKNDRIVFERALESAKIWTARLSSGGGQ